MNVVLLMGLPGAGKSTYAASNFHDYYIVNQDTLGSREACIKEVSRLLDNRSNVVIDRTNINTQQRKYWIDLALQYGANEVKCIFLNVPAEECIARVVTRKGHATISEEMPVDKKREIVYKFHSMLELPLLEEGFSEIVMRRN